MLSFTGIFAVCWVLALASAVKAEGPAHDKNVLCKINGKEIVGLTEEKFNFDLCTHLIIYKGQLESEESFRLKSKKDESELIEKLQKKWPNLKFLAEVDFAHIVKYYADMKDAKREDKYIKYVTDAAKDNHFDGYDMIVGDLEKFVRDVPPEKAASFLTRAKTSFEKAGLTSVMSFRGQEVTKFPFTIFVDNVDLFNCMPEYDVNNIPKDYTFQDALTSSFRISNEQKIIDNLIELGVPKTKLIMGFHFGGPFFKPKFHKDVDYTTICKYQTTSNLWKRTHIQNNGFALLHREEQIISFVDSKKNLIFFMDSRSIANRMRYAMKNELAGASIVSIVADDVEGLCKPEDSIFRDFLTSREEIIIHLPEERKNEKYPLLQTINEAIDVTLDEMQQEEREAEKDKEREKEKEKEKEKDKQSNGSGSISAHLVHSILIVVLAFLLY